VILAFGHLVLILSSDKATDPFVAASQMLNPFMQQLSNQGLNPIFCLHSASIPSYRKVHDNYLQLIKMCNSIEDTPNPNHLVRCIDDMNKELIIPDYIKSAALIAEIKGFIEENYASDMNLKTIAASYNMNAFYLGQIFKTVIGDTFTSYLNQLRIEKAKILLSDPFVKVIDVAEKVGYYNTNYFYTIFKKITGMTPANYSVLSMK
jgi:YesN/AraC family two-component response regulator